MMERRIKERLIGATVLVVLVVLVVPALLSGPRPHRPATPQTLAAPAFSNRTVEVDLSTSKATVAAESMESPSAVAAPDVPASAAPSAGDAALEGAAAHDSEAPLEGEAPVRGEAPVVGAAPAAPPLESAAPSPTPGVSGGASKIARGRRAWSVQLGSFSKRANADKLAQQLGAHGATQVYVSPSGAGASLRYRVRIGPLADRGAAERAAVKLRASGHAATVVAPAA